MAMPVAAGTRPRSYIHLVLHQPGLGAGSPQALLQLPAWVNAGGSGPQRMLRAPLGEPLAPEVDQLCEGEPDPTGAAVTVAQYQPRGWTEKLAPAAKHLCFAVPPRATDSSCYHALRLLLEFDFLSELGTRPQPVAGGGRLFALSVEKVSFV